MTTSDARFGGNHDCGTDDSGLGDPDGYVHRSVLALAAGHSDHLPVLDCRHDLDWLQAVITD